MSYHQTAWVHNHVEKAMEKGISVHVDGISYKELSKEEWGIVFENKPYMIEYEGDEEGRIVAMNFRAIDSL